MKSLKVELAEPVSSPIQWYAAHIVMAVKLLEGTQTEFPIWENIILISATNADEAYEKAEIRARDDEGGDGFTWDGIPATWVFAGIRKMVSCVDPEQRPGDGTELTYSSFQFDNEDDLKAFAAGKEVRLTIGDEEPVEFKKINHAHSQCP